MKKLEEVLQKIRSQRRMGYVKEDRQCPHREWCDWMSCAPFCLDCGWGMPESFLKD
jgi:hypothetical protein